MFRKIRNARFLIAAALLMVLFTINSKDLLHSFVQHNPIACVDHVDGEDELAHHPISAVNSYKYCLFCHFEFSSYFLTATFSNAGSSFDYYASIFYGVAEIYLPSQVCTLSLRGPPAIV